MYLDDESEAFRKQPFIAFRFLPFHRDDCKVRGICMMAVSTIPPTPPPRLSLLVQILSTENR
jgi:hypothetical protein